MNECNGREAYIWMISKTEYGITLRIRQKNKRESEKRKVLWLNWLEADAEGGKYERCI